MYFKVRSRTGSGNFFRNVTVQDRVNRNHVEIAPVRGRAGVYLVASAFTVACAGSVLPNRTLSPASESWRTAPSMLHARSAHAVASTGKAIYVIGGTGEDKKNAL